MKVSAKTMDFIDAMRYNVDCTFTHHESCAITVCLKNKQTSRGEKETARSESWGVKVEQVLERLAEQQEDPEVPEKTTARLGDSQQQPKEENLHFEGKEGGEVVEEVFRDRGRR